MTEDEIAKIVVQAALDLHREFGPGLLESVYEVLLVTTLRELARAEGRDPCRRQEFGDGVSLGAEGAVSFGTASKPRGGDLLGAARSLAMACITTAADIYFPRACQTE